MEQPDREEMRVLAAKLATRIPDRATRQQALLIAKRKVPPGAIRNHFNRVCRWVRNSKSNRIDQKTRAEVTEWLAHWGTPLRQAEPLRPHRLEMRLNPEERAQVERAAAKAGLKMADFARRATLLAAERTLGGK